MLKQQVLNTISKNELISYGDGIVVGISGGYDSVCLLHILYTIAEEYSLKLYPVHINHMLRGEEAMRDEAFVRSFCESLKLVPVLTRIDIAKKAKEEKLSLEEAGRNARYQEFGRVLMETGATKIAVAHSKNDQVETLLMRIFRGTGPEGLKGIEYKRDKIIRPLLDTDRKEIENYVKEWGLTAIDDSSNFHTDYFRNRIRLKVIPEINKAAEKDITENLLRLSKIIVADEDYLRYNSELYYKSAVQEKSKDYLALELKALAQSHEAICSRVLRAAYADISGSVTGLEYVHIDKLLGLIYRGRTGAGLDLPLGYRAVRTYKSIVIQKQGQKKAEDFYYNLEVPGETSLLHSDCIIRSEIISIQKLEEIPQLVNSKRALNTEIFDYEKIRKQLTRDENLKLVVRNRRNGDIFKPFKSNGTKKLKEYFIDNKISIDQRNSLPLIAINKEIIWIIGNKTSDNYKVTDNTKSVLKISYYD